MTNLDSILKSRDITLPTNVRLVKAMVFPVVRYGCESWSIKKAECQRIDAFEFWCWRRPLRVPWTTRRSKQSILKEISPEYSLEGLMLRLKLQYFGHQMQWTDSLVKTLMLGKIEARGEGDGMTELKWVGWTRLTWVLSKLWELVMVRETLRSAVHGITKSRTWLSDWTELNWTELYIFGHSGSSFLYLRQARPALYLWCLVFSLLWLLLLWSTDHWCTGFSLCGA